MPAMYQKLFPELSGNDKVWRYFDLGYLSTLFFPADVNTRGNPLLDPHTCSRWVENMHKLFYCDYSFGGYMEDRTHLWRDSYLTKDHRPNPHNPKSGLKTVHLGIDFNVPCGTLVHSPVAGEVIDVFVDKDTEGGWGGRVAVKLDSWKMYGETALVLGHLAHNGLPSVGDKIAVGDSLGFVARYPENGDWYPHLHVQWSVLPPDDLAEYFKDYDGYGVWDIDYKHSHPNPAIVLATI